MALKINKTQICSIRTFINKIDTSFKYHEEKKFFFIPIVKCGFYSRYEISNRRYSIEEIESKGDLICKEKLVFFKPYISIRMSDGCNFTKKFETVTDLNEFVDDLTKDSDWIQLF